MDPLVMVPVLVIGALLAGGLILVRKSAAAAAARDAGLRDWASRNAFRVEIRPEPPVRVRVSGQDEVSFVLEARNDGEGSHEVITEWRSGEFRAARIELIVVVKELHDFFQSKLGQMIVSMAGRVGDRKGAAKERMLGRLQAMTEFTKIPSVLGAGRYVALAREPARWSELLSREVEALLEAWPKTRQPFDAPAITLDDTGLTVELWSCEEEPEKLHHLIRIGAAVARAGREAGLG